MGMENPVTILEQNLVLSKIKKFFVEELGRDWNGEVIEKLTNIVDLAKFWTDGEDYEVAGDGNANGTSICSLSIADEAVFEQSALCGEFIDIFCDAVLFDEVVHSGFVSAQSLERVVVGEEKQDIRLFWFGGS